MSLPMQSPELSAQTPHDALCGPFVC